MHRHEIPHFSAAAVDTGTDFLKKESADSETTYTTSNRIYPNFQPWFTHSKHTQQYDNRVNKTVLLLIGNPEN
jgi:hypothetical protein